MGVGIPETGDLRVRLCTAGDVDEVRWLCREVQGDMAREEATTHITKLIKHPSLPILATALTAVFYKLGIGQWWSLLIGVGITIVAAALTFHRFWRKVRRIFQEGPDIKNLMEYYSLPHRAFLVATCGREVSGVIGLRETEEPEVAKLWRMFVNPKFRRRGVASKLITAVHEEAARLGYSSVQLRTHTTNTGAVKCYERAGYKPQGNAVFLSMYPLSFDTVHYAHQLPASPSTTY